MCTFTRVGLNRLWLCLWEHFCFLLPTAIAEIISKRRVNQKWEFYVHYVNCEFAVVLSKSVMCQQYLNQQ